MAIRLNSSWDNEGHAGNMVQLGAVSALITEGQSFVQHFRPFIWANVGHIAMTV